MAGERAEDAEQEAADGALDRLLRAHGLVELVLAEEAAEKIRACVGEPREQKRQHDEARAGRSRSVAAQERKRAEAAAEVERAEGAGRNTERGGLDVAEPGEHQEHRRERQDQA